MSLLLKHTHLLLVFFMLFPMIQCGNLELSESTEQEDDHDNDADDDGSHHPGEDCGSCHGNQAEQYSISGTIYTDSSGTTTKPGGVIIIRDINGGEIMKLTADSLGNFYTNKIVIYPAKAESKTSSIKMKQTFGMTGRSCNQSGCHDSSRRIY